MATFEGETQGDKITRLAKEAFESDSPDATRAFLEEVSSLPNKEAVAESIKQSQSGGLVESVMHYFSGNPTISWSEESSGWQQLKFNDGRKEISWNSYVDDVSEMSDEDVARYEDDPGAEAKRITELAKAALASDDVAATKNFLGALETTRYSRIDLAEIIESDYSGKKGNPRISWNWDSNPHGRWAKEIEFRKGDKEIRWHTNMEDLESMSDAEISEHERDYAEERKQEKQERQEFKQYLREAYAEASELSNLSIKVFNDPESIEKQKALLLALEKTSPLKTSTGVHDLKASGITVPEIDVNINAHPLGESLESIQFTRNGKTITWKPGDEKLEVKG